MTSTQASTLHAPAAPAVPGEGDPPTARDRTLVQRRLLPPLQVLSLVSLAIATLWWVPGVGMPLQELWGVALLWAGVTVVVAVLWWLRARSSSPRTRALLSVVVAVALLPVSLLGTVGLSYAVLLVAVALLVVDLGRRTGLVAIGVMLLAGVLLHTLGGAGPVPGLLNSLPVAVLLCVGVALGSALAAYEEAHARDLRLVADRDRAVQRLAEALDRLRRTSEVEKELLLADERARSARELHDGLGQRLTLISLGLEYARRARERDPEAAWAEVGTADATAREALAEMRTWVRALSPVRDPDATGAAAIEAIAESFRGTGLEVEVSADPALELGPDAALLLYRTVQEGLTNALRHARARTVRISLARADGLAELSLVHDLAPERRALVPEGDFTPGFGLRSLQERAVGRGGGVTAGRHGDEVAVRVRFDPALRFAQTGGPGVRA